MPLLVVEEGTNRGAVFPVRAGEVLLGRDAERDVPIYDVQASRRHCAIRREGEGFVLVDLGSRNGTTLNGLPVHSAPRELRGGDLIRIGSTIFRFDADAAPGGPEGALDGDRSTAAGDSEAAVAARAACLLARDDPRRLLAQGLIVAESAAMRAVLQALGRAARSVAAVLLEGESGTGKELCARAIHAGSARARGGFVGVNCAALPEQLLDSELFGHERGAFTGAEALRKGLFELAHGGTLFLDEVGECGPALQSKLLRALDRGEFRRVGGSETLRSDARIVAATNRDLRRMVEDGGFREDLYYRLSVVAIAIPPLRDRPDDIEPLAAATLARLGRERGARATPTLAQPALAALLRYPFPGNVRELRNILERALILGDGRTIEVADLPAEVRSGAAEAPSGGPLSLHEAERRHVARVLEEVAWNKTRAAKVLGVDRKTLYAKLAAFGLVPPKKAPGP